MTNRAPPPTSMQTRFGFIPRPTSSGLHQYHSSTIASRSRSISPTSTVSVNSSSSSSVISQRVKPPSTQIVPPSKATRDPSVSKTNPRSTVQSTTKPTSTIRSRTPSRTSSTTSPTSSTTISPESSSTLKTDINAIRDRYRSQKRMNFFARHTPISTANGSPMPNSIKSPEPTIKKLISPPIKTNISVKTKHFFIQFFVSFENRQNDCNLKHLHRALIQPIQASHIHHQLQLHIFLVVQTIDNVQLACCQLHQAFLMY